MSEQTILITVRATIPEGAVDHARQYEGTSGTVRDYLRLMAQEVYAVVWERLEDARVQATHVQDHKATPGPVIGVYDWEAKACS